MPPLRGASVHPDDADGHALSAIMEKLAEGVNLTPTQADAAFARLMDGKMSASQAGAFLLGLRAKGESPEEMAAAVGAILERSIPIDMPAYEPVLDVVGTGGDKRNSFNCSTATALTLAAMGERVLKHGNRSVSSRCGSADVLERLGLDIEIPAEQVPARLAGDGFVFLFAPRFHPSFRHVMPIRRELGVRTLFNLLGPLVNPARPGICFLGVPNEESLVLLAKTLARMGSRKGAVICGCGGYDELTTLGPAKIAYVNDKTIRFDSLDPRDFGFSPCKPEELAIANPEEGAAVLGELLAGRGPAPMREMLALNVGFGLHLLHEEKDLAACMAEAGSAVASGLPAKYLRKLLDRRSASASPKHH